jgi:hypothetical protein
MALKVTFAVLSALGGAYYLGRALVLLKAGKTSDVPLYAFGGFLGLGAGLFVAMMLRPMASML